MKITYRLTLVLLVILQLVTYSALAQKRSNEEGKMKNLINKVLDAKTKAQKEDAAEHLLDFSDSIDCAKISDKTLYKIASLLNIEDDGIRTWIAPALADFGKRANFAIPKLLDIYAQIECTDYEFSSAATIPKALEKMGYKPPIIHCKR